MSTRPPAAVVADRHLALYREFHAHPELSNQEHRTAARVAELLRSYGAEVHVGVGGTGVVAKLHNGSGPTVLLRSELDGLPIRERTGLPWASTTDAVDDHGRPQPVMHACGHDLHIVALLAAVEGLAASRHDWRGTVVAVFQPAEELLTGAAAMVADGLVELVGPVAVVLAQHVMALPAGAVHLRTGPTLSASRSLTVTVHGRGTHAATPHQGVDPVVLAAMIVVRLQGIVAREVAPGRFAVVTVGALHAGTSANTIPQEATMEVNLRAEDRIGLDALTAAVERTVRAECQASGAIAPPDVVVTRECPPTINDEAAVARFAAGLAHHCPDVVVRPLDFQSASEDVAHLADAFGAPCCYWGVGGTASANRDQDGAQPPPTNHSPLFAPDASDVLGVAVPALTAAALSWLAVVPDPHP